MADGTCSVPDCEEPISVKRLQLCRMHYMRWYRTGDPGSAEKKYKPNPPQCTFEGCESKATERGLCNMHRKRERKHGDPARGARPPADATGYLGMHHRLRKLHGHAGEHPCRHCGERADDWAYDYGDPNQRLDQRRGPYSTDLARYMPLCRSCHKRFDLVRRVSSC